MSDIWNLTSICRFCHRDGNFRTFTLPNNHNGILESYGDILQKTFNISMTIPSLVNVSNMICDDCISSLTDAAKFKEQIVACENKFQQYVKNEFFTIASDIKDSFPQDIKIEAVDNSDKVEVEIEFDETTLVKMKKSPNSDNGDDSSFWHNNGDESCVSDENIIKPDLELEEENNVAKKGQNKRNVNSKNSIGKKNKRIAITNNITCSICFKNMPRSELRKHIKSHKGPYNCKFCGEKFVKYATISLHVQNEHAKLYTCNFCQQTCKSEASLLHHLNNHTRQKMFQCDICHIRQDYKSAMVRHLKTHDPERADKIYECPRCFWKFANKTNLITHIKVVHDGIKDYRCTICASTFGTKKSMVAHLRTHTGDRPYECDICNKKFRTSETLRSHKKIHQEDRKRPGKGLYECSKCNLIFDHKGIYIDHLKTHPESLIICEHCGMILSCNKSLNRHKLSHSQKRFFCDLCDNIFKTKSQIQRHINRIHLNVFEKFKCEVCGKLVFNLKQHQLTHTNRQFVCTVCGKAYTERKTLTRHMKEVHCGYNKKYVCEVCGKSYTKQCYLKRHKLKCGNKNVI